MFIYILITLLLLTLYLGKPIEYFTKLDRPYLKPAIQYPLLTSPPEAVWSDWSKCDAECGIGTQERECLSGDCIGESSRKCQNKLCPEWSEWSQCSKLCGNGIQVRSCLEGECDGYDEKKCNLGDCPDYVTDKELEVVWVHNRYNTLFFQDKLQKETIKLVPGRGYEIVQDNFINFPNKNMSYDINIVVDGEDTTVRVIVKEFVHNKEFSNLVKTFFYEMLKFRVSSQYSEKDVFVCFDPKHTLLEGVNAETYNYKDKVYIVINKQKWDRMDYVSKELLIFHELGHGVLNRSWPTFHTSDFMTDKLGRMIPVSIMGHPKVPSYVYEKNRNIYLHELFFSKDNKEINYNQILELKHYEDLSIKFSISGVYLKDKLFIGIQKDNVTSEPIQLLLKGFIKGEKTVNINKIVDVPSDKEGMSYSTMIELSDNVKKGIEVDLELNYNGKILDIIDTIVV